MLKIHLLNKIKLKLQSKYFIGRPSKYFTYNNFNLKILAANYREIFIKFLVEQVNLNAKVSEEWRNTVWMLNLFGLRIFIKARNLMCLDGSKDQILFEKNSNDQKQ